MTFQLDLSKSTNQSKMCFHQFPNKSLIIDDMFWSLNRSVYSFQECFVAQILVSGPFRVCYVTDGRSTYTLLVITNRLILKAVMQSTDCLTLLKLSSLHL